MAKLTEAQRRVLADLEARGEYGERMSVDYAPAAKLRILGFANMEDESFGAAFFTITEAGRRALEEGK